LTASDPALPLARGLCILFYGRAEDVPMENPVEISRDDFATLCRALELPLSPEEAERLREAYNGIKTLIRRIPLDETFIPEPATLYAHPGTRLIK
jgi:hypothetical protein